VAAEAELDVEAILERLTAHGTDYVVIGGIAAVLWGSPRNTFDLDICPATDPGNLEALGKALVDLDARLRGIEEDVPFVPDASALSRIELLTLTTRAGPLDVLVQPGGVGYKRLRKNAERVDVGRFSVLVASIGDLMALKRSAGRPKDEIDIEELEAIARLRRRIERDRK
jgi:hypothetical protein